jgi:hypothetical protein
MKAPLKLVIAYLLLALVGGFGWLWTTSVDRNEFSPEVLNLCESSVRDVSG